MPPASLPRALRPCRRMSSVLLARLLALDDLRAGDLVVQGLALVVPERPQTVEQEDDEVDAADEGHELDRGEQASTDGRDDVEGARGVSTTDTDAEDHLAGSLRGRGPEGDAVDRREDPRNQTGPDGLAGDLVDERGHRRLVLGRGGVDGPLDGGQAARRARSQGRV